MTGHLLLLLVSGLFASSANVTERRLSVSAFDRIRVDGPFKVRVTTGVAPYATVTGSNAAIERVSLSVQGRTLVVRPNPSSWGGNYPGEAIGPVELAVGTHDLSAVWVNGAGALSIDKVKGLSFEIAVQGSGAATIGQTTVDQLKVAINGTGNARLVGTAAKVTVVVRGVSSLDGSSLSVKDATIGAEGPSTVRLTATNSAKVDARGTATVDLAGDPACTVNAQGSATVNGCR